MMKKQTTTRRRSEWLSGAGRYTPRQDDKKAIGEVDSWSASAHGQSATNRFDPE